MGVRPVRAAGFALAALVAVSGAASAAPHRRPPVSLDRMFAAAVSAPSLRSYTVQVQFKVRLHKPIRLRANVDGTAYFRAPAQSALQITHASGLIGGFFKGAYKLDVVPQAWPYTYHVLSQTRTQLNGQTVLQLTAQPRASATTVARVVFTLSLPDHQPLLADWQYQDGSTIHLAFVNGRAGAYTLPQQATISVDMPHSKLDADATYGEYQLNVPVSDDVFRAAK
jgi:hypothetical protein